MKISRPDKVAVEQKSDLFSVLHQAEEALLKLQRDATKLIQKLAGTQQYQMLKAHSQKASTLIQDMKTMVQWKENRDGTPLSKESLQSFLKDVAEDTNKFNQDVESSKGIIRAMR